MLYNDFNKGDICMEHESKSFIAVLFKLVLWAAVLAGLFKYIKERLPKGKESYELPYMRTYTELTRRTE